MRLKSEKGGREVGGKCNERMEDQEPLEAVLLEHVTTGLSITAQGGHRHLHLLFTLSANSSSAASLYL